MNKIYCLQCKQKTENVNPHIIVTKNNRKRMSAICKFCKRLKSGFIN